MPYKVYVYSTLTSDMLYTKYKPAIEGQQLRQVDRQVRIHGGANLSNKHLFTPRGLVTEVTEEELEILEQDGVFQTHKKEKYIHVDKIKVDPERMVADAGMQQKDSSAPITPEDYKNHRDILSLPEDERPEIKTKEKVGT